MFIEKQFGFWIIQLKKIILIAAKKNLGLLFFYMYIYILYILWTTRDQ